MSAKPLTWDEVRLGTLHEGKPLGNGLQAIPGAVEKVQRWLNRGDGIAVYENIDMGHPMLGDRRYVSYGSATAQLTDTPPERLPDGVGGSINWRYQLVGVYRPEWTCPNGCPNPRPALWPAPPGGKTPPCSNCDAPLQEVS